MVFDMNNKREPDFLEKFGDKLQLLISENPMYYLGLFSLFVGIFIVAASVFNWDWIFKGHSYNLQKIEGIANFFGRGFARIYFGICGIICCAVGIILIYINH